MAARYATKTESVELTGKPITIPAGATRDSVTDAAVIALHSTNWTATAPVAGVGDVTGIMGGYLAAFPRAEVK